MTIGKQEAPRPSRSWVVRREYLRLELAHDLLESLLSCGGRRKRQKRLLAPPGAFDATPCMSAAVEYQHCVSSRAELLLRLVRDEHEVGAVGDGDRLCVRCVYDAAPAGECGCAVQLLRSATAGLIQSGARDACCSRQATNLLPPLSGVCAALKVRVSPGIGVDSASL